MTSRYTTPRTRNGEGFTSSSAAPLERARPWPPRTTPTTGPCSTCPPAARPPTTPATELLHTSQTIDRPALRLPLIGRTIRDRELVTGAVVGVARINDCHQDLEGAPLCSEWAHPGAWHLVLQDVQELPLPVPARGQVVPWKPSPDLLERVFQQLPDFRP
ncbi:hypothetical protein [Streptomyces sp. A1277]|uniref:hypothetical protein n=1 Tax=Streptomyces sp. A1277 TaxID=2563103 RepID=UPI001F0D659C|nr:hypothetical protein [Streptomyces sp. A1277]